MCAYIMHVPYVRKNQRVCRKLALTQAEPAPYILRVWTRYRDSRLSQRGPRDALVPSLYICVLRATLNQHTIISIVRLFHAQAAGREHGQAAGRPPEQRRRGRVGGDDDDGVEAGTGRRQQAVRRLHRRRPPRRRHRARPRHDLLFHGAAAPYGKLVWGSLLVEERLYLLHDLASCVW